MHTSDRSVLLLEMNEIPWRVIDLYKCDDRYPHIQKFFERSENYTSVCPDKDSLSPWQTWPTLHRGMSRENHNIWNLGQDVNSYKGETIWEELRKQGHDVGICGSLQSWPPKEPGKNGFYIPDTFAPDQQCYPSYIEPFQKLNLDLVRKNGRVVSKTLGSKRNLFNLLLSLPKLGIKISTCIEILLQLVKERFNQNYVARRPIFQTVLVWDIFTKLYNPKNPPKFATFFSNHVAGVMHRYWKHVFPEDFGLAEKESLPHKETMDFAMQVLDRILKKAMEYVKQNQNIVVLFATSMGQEKIIYEEHEGFEASVSNLELLFDKIRVPRAGWVNRLAMVPQVAAGIEDDELRKNIKLSVESIQDASGNKMFSVAEIGDSLSLTINTPRKADIDAGYCLLTALNGQSIKLTFAELGLQMNEVEAATAYHMPYGVFSLYGKEAIISNKRQEVCAGKIKDIILALVGPQYSKKRAELGMYSS